MSNKNPTKVGGERRCSGTKLGSNGHWMVPNQNNI